MDDGDVAAAIARRVIRSALKRSVLHGNSTPANFVDDIEEWGLVTQKKWIGVGKTFHYTVIRLVQLARKVEKRGVPVEGWLHFCVKGVHQKEIGASVYRLIVLTPNGAITRDIAGATGLAAEEGMQFQKVPCASCGSPIKDYGLLR